MSVKEVKSDRRYTREHEWAKLEDDVLTVGITAFAVDQLGDITLVDFDVSAGDQIKAGTPFGTIESVKTLSDLFAPVSGEVLELNDELEEQPELVNEDCWGQGWLLKVRCDDPAVMKDLLDHDAYLEHTEHDDN